MSVECMEPRLLGGKTPHSCIRLVGTPVNVLRREFCLRQQKMQQRDGHVRDYSLYMGSFASLTSILALGYRRHVDALDVDALENATNNEKITEKQPGVSDTKTYFLST